MRRPLQGRELEIFNVWQRISLEQNARASARQVADALNLTRANVHMVLTRLVRKGYMERVAYAQARPLENPDYELSGTTNSGLILTIELTGNQADVIQQVDLALDRLRGFKKGLLHPTPRPNRLKEHPLRECAYRLCFETFRPINTQHTYCSRACAKSAQLERDRANLKSKRARVNAYRRRLLSGDAS